MKKSEIQGKLWGKEPKGWAEIQEPMHKPLWNAMLNATEVGTDTIFLDVGCGAGEQVASQKNEEPIFMELIWQKDCLLSPFKIFPVENSKLQILKTYPIRIICLM